MRVISLGSGSSGNSLLVEAGPGGRTKLLLDAGLTGWLLIERLKQAGVSPAQLQGIFVTHEHGDHVIGVPLLLKRYAIPLIADSRTLEVIENHLMTGMWRTDSGALVALETDDGAGASLPDAKIERALSLPIGSRRVIGDIEVLSFATSHDAVAPCGYLLSAGGCRVCVVTDTGEVTAAMLEAMRLADLLILESNHDRERLLRGPYPYPLKQRILSLTGHLSNDQAADAVLRTWREDSVRWLWLAHLSRTNNTPRLALQSMRTNIVTAGANLEQVHITVLPPGVGPIWDSTQLWHAPTLWETHLKP